METFEAITNRGSVREYQEKPVPREILTKLVDAGRRAPSARHVEPWEFIVVTDRSILKRIAGLAANGSFIKDAAAGIVVFCRDTKYYLEDGCAATENILLQAADSGLGACWIAGDKKDYAGEIANMLGLPPEHKLVSIVALGWPAHETKQVKERGLEDVLHWNRF